MHSQKAPETLTGPFVYDPSKHKIGKFESRVSNEPPDLIGLTQDKERDKHVIVMLDKRGRVRAYQHIEFKQRHDGTAELHLIATRIDNAFCGQGYFGALLGGSYEFGLERARARGAFLADFSALTYGKLIEHHAKHLFELRPGQRNGLVYMDIPLSDNNRATLTAWAKAGRVDMPPRPTSMPTNAADKPLEARV